MPPIDEEDDDRLYIVLVNDEEQYSLWPSDISIPDGWKQVIEPRSKSDCIQFVDEVWTDLRPLSLRRKMAEAARN